MSREVALLKMDVHGSVGGGCLHERTKRTIVHGTFNKKSPIYLLRRAGEHRDIELLEQAIAKVKNVMTHLNEEKRRTEGQIHIFDIYSEIDNCPASVVSSHRR